MKFGHHAQNFMLFHIIPKKVLFNLIKVALLLILQSGTGLGHGVYRIITLYMNCIFSGLEHLLGVKFTNVTLPRRVDEILQKNFLKLLDKLHFVIFKHTYT